VEFLGKDIRCGVFAAIHQMGIERLVDLGKGQVLRQRAD